MLVTSTITHQTIVHFQANEIHYHRISRYLTSLCYFILTLVSDYEQNLHQGKLWQGGPIGVHTDRDLLERGRLTYGAYLASCTIPPPKISITILTRHSNNYRQLSFCKPVGRRSLHRLKGISHETFFSLYYVIFKIQIPQRRSSKSLLLLIKALK